MKFVGTETADLESKMPEYEKAVQSGIMGASVKGILNDRGLALMCAKAELDGHKELNKSLKMRYDQIMDFFRRHVLYLQSERKKLAEELKFAPDHPKELTKELREASIHYEKIYRILQEQHQHKFILSQLAFSSEKEKNEHLNRMEVEMDEHVRLGSIQHLTTLKQMQAKHGCSEENVIDDTKAEQTSGTCVGDEKTDEHLVAIMGYNIERTVDYYKTMDLENLDVDDEMAVQKF